MSKRSTKRNDSPVNRLRRTRLYIPGNNPAMIQNAVVYGADSLIFDLEDSISLDEKDSARHLVRNALLTLDFEACEVTVRVNSLDTEFFIKDLEAIVPTKPDGLLLPKTQSLDELIRVGDLISEIEEKNDISIGTIKLMPIIESAKGVLNVEKFAEAPRVIALGMGGEDLVADIGAKRTKFGRELDYISSKIILACAANKIQAIDTVFIDVNDTEGLYEASLRAIEIGFQGKSVIHPSQIQHVHRAFSPSQEEIERARRIVKAYKDAKKKSLGVISVDGRMVDLPVVRRSEKILKWAEASQQKI